MAVYAINILQPPIVNSSKILCNYDEGGRKNRFTCRQEFVLFSVNMAENGKYFKLEKRASFERRGMLG